MLRRMLDERAAPSARSRRQPGACLRPVASAWVSANAGTGKTEVLVRRSLRLLLAGFRPESILCLTYTKTAAAEMQNRLLERPCRLGDHAGGQFDEKLVALLRRAPEDEELVAARRLFARALEAKGGLKIHTIHGFCERLLQRFPLEVASDSAFLGARRARAGVATACRLRRAISRAAEDSDGMLGKALAE